MAKEPSKQGKGQSKKKGITKEKVMEAIKSPEFIEWLKSPLIDYLTRTVQTLKEKKKENKGISDKEKKRFEAMWNQIYLRAKTSKVSGSQIPEQVVMVKIGVLNNLKKNFKELFPGEKFNWEDEKEK